MNGVRYLFYVAFALASLVFWALVAMFLFGMFPFADPACHFEPAGCLPMPLWRQLINMILVYAALPLTVLIFVFFRRWVRRKLGFDDE